ncbi:hypothetical protein [Actinoplanes sp. NPDC049118]|uniref:hypothetical protein n=1 Tax=Actinoplanes sp. NPDC049118 TaxID=3155769 RepID=UPI0033C8FAD2
MQLDLSTVTLGSGLSNSPEQGIFLLRAVALYAGEDPAGDPACVSPTLCMVGRWLSWALPAEARQELKPLIPRLVGTAGDGLDEARSYLALDWVIRTHVPAWLDLAGLPAPARSLRELRPITHLMAAEQAAPLVEKAWESARAAADATADAAEVVVGADVVNAVTESVWEASEQAIRLTIGDVDQDVEEAVGEAAWQAASGGVARGAAMQAAWAVGWAAFARAAKSAASTTPRAAARSAFPGARGALRPTEHHLQASAIALYRRMVSPGDV